VYWSVFAHAVINCYCLFIVLEGSVKKSLYEMVNNVIRFGHRNEYARKLTHTHMSATVFLNFFT